MNSSLVTMLVADHDRLASLEARVATLAIAAVECAETCARLRADAEALAARVDALTGVAATPRPNGTGEHPY